MDNMLYRLLIRVKPPEVCLYTVSLGTSNLRDEQQPLQTWHHLLSHLNHKAIRRMANPNLVDGIQLTSSTEEFFAKNVPRVNNATTAFLLVTLAHELQYLVNLSIRISADRCQPDLLAVPIILPYFVFPMRLSIAILTNLTFSTPYRRLSNIFNRKQVFLSKRLGVTVVPNSQIEKLFNISETRIFGKT